MKEKRCKTCIYCGWVASTRCCDYMFFTGHSRTAGLTKEQKAGPCLVYKEGKHQRRVYRLGRIDGVWPYGRAEVQDDGT